MGLHSGGWLTDRTISLCMKLLKASFHAPGLHDSGRQENHSWRSKLQYLDGDGCQIFHANENHWVLCAKVKGKIYLLDSLGTAGPIQNPLLEAIAMMFVHPSKRSVFTSKSITRPQLQLQIGHNDCGLYALAYAEYYLRKRALPLHVQFDQNQMRTHLIECIYLYGYISPFPIVNNDSNKSSMKIKQ
jgi:hypothetical protein